MYAFLSPPSWSIPDRTPTHGYEATREAAMAAFAKCWPREYTRKQEIDTSQRLTPRPEP
jgi:hypothetical protein